MVVDLEAENAVLRSRIAELERGAQESDPLTRALLVHAPGFLNVVTPDGRMVVTGRDSPAFGSVVGRSIFEFTDPSSHATLRSALAQACATGRPVNYEVTGFGEDGSPGRVYRVRAVPLVEAGEVRLIVLAPTDITDHVLLETSLAEREAALRVAIDATRIGLWQWNVPKNEVSWDDRLLQIWGLRETPPTYEAYREFIHPDDREKVEGAIRTALETGAYPTLQHRLRHAGTGETRHVLAVATVVNDAEGKPMRLMGGVLDVTDQRRLEAQMARAARVEAIGQLTAGLAHNFNNLLTVIIPNVESSISDARTAAEREPLQAALEASLQARDLVKRLLDLARRPIDTAEGAIARPADVIARVVAICRATFPREIDLSTVVPEGLGGVPMEPSALEQVFLNLLLNARDAVEGVTDRGPQVRVEVDRLRTGSCTRLHIRILDNGVGMTEAVRAQLFEPFFTTKPPHRGSGLGLANALVRIREAGGELSCASTSPEGTTFLLVLPEVTTVAAKSSTDEGFAAARGEMILLVDDEPFVRGAVRRFLELEGYVVLEAGTAAQAKAILEGPSSLAIRLILLDQSMPHESGAAAIPAIRQRSSAPIVLFTGMATERPPGVAAVFEKPARPAELLRLLREVLDTPRDHRSG